MREGDVRSEEEVAMRLGRLLRGELRALGDAIRALPDDHPRRALLLANYRLAMALLDDLPRILGAPVPG